jgi:hypothetical protein
MVVIGTLRGLRKDRDAAACVGQHALLFIESMYLLVSLARLMALGCGKRL